MVLSGVMRPVHAAELRGKRGRIDVAAEATAATATEALLRTRLSSGIAPPWNTITSYLLDRLP